MGFILTDKKFTEGYDFCLGAFENNVYMLACKYNWEYKCVREVHNDFETGLIAAAWNLY